MVDPHGVSFFQVLTDTKIHNINVTVQFVQDLKWISTVSMQLFNNLTNIKSF